MEAVSHCERVKYATLLSFSALLTVVSWRVAWLFALFQDFVFVPTHNLAQGSAQ